MSERKRSYTAVSRDWSEMSLVTFTEGMITVISPQLAENILRGADTFGIGGIEVGSLEDKKRIVREILVDIMGYTYLEATIDQVKTELELLGMLSNPPTRF